MTSMFVPNLELIGPSSRIKDVKYLFSLKMATWEWQQTHALTHLSAKTWTLLLGEAFARTWNHLIKESYNMGHYGTDIYFTSSNVSPFLTYNHSL